MAIKSKIIGGRRITAHETRDAAIMVFAGLLNKRLAAAISAEGQPAVGISAADSRCFLAEPMVHNEVEGEEAPRIRRDRKSTRLNSSHGYISYAVFCLKKKKHAHQLPDHVM